MTAADFASVTSLSHVDFSQPIYFAIKDKRWIDLVEAKELPLPDDLRSRWTQPHDCWVVLTYLQLARRGAPVKLVTRPVPKAICVVASSELGLRDDLHSSFLVVCRHDYFRPGIGQQVITQNLFQVERENDHFIPHWPQPGLIPRDDSRGDTIRRIVFRGGSNNLLESLKTREFSADLASLDVEIDVGDQRSTSDRATDWWDYSDADLSIAIRNLTFVDARNKPASKLVNSWLAGCPALLGPEPAFQDLRCSEEDFISIRGPSDVVRAVSALKEDPRRYRAMITQGFKRAQDFTPDAIAARWARLLSGPITRAYENWSSGNSFSHYVNFPIHAAQHLRAKSGFRESFASGPRILDHDTPA